MNRWINWDLDHFDPTNSNQLQALQTELTELKSRLAEQNVYFRSDYTGQMTLTYTKTPNQIVLPLSEDAQELINWGFVAPEIFDQDRVRLGQNRQLNKKSVTFTINDNFGDEYEVTIGYHSTKDEDVEAPVSVTFQAYDDQLEQDATPNEFLAVQIIKTLKEPQSHELKDVPLTHHHEFNYIKTDHHITKIIWTKGYYVINHTTDERTFWTRWGWLN